MRTRRIQGFFCYLVGWDSELVIKAGVTFYRERWRAFENRGATLYQLVDTAPGVSSVDVEQKVERFLGATFPRAFSEKADARSMLGGQGGGYLECHRAPNESAYVDALSTCSSIMLEHPGVHGRLPMPAHMHGRTDVQTYLEPHSPNATNLKFSNVRACTANEGNGVGE